MPFTDILTANSAYAADHEELANGRARRGLAIVTCIDTRIDPLEAFGLIPGDAKVIRNAGARVTDDVIRTLIIATYVLGVNRIALIQHTDCGVANNTQSTIEDVVQAVSGESASAIDFLTIDDQVATLHADADKIRNHQLLDDGIEVGEFMFDVRSGALDQIN
jgi:carbonic anhydrase